MFECKNIPEAYLHAKKIVGVDTENNVIEDRTGRNAITPVASQIGLFNISNNIRYNIFVDKMEYFVGSEFNFQ